MKAAFTAFRSTFAVTVAAAFALSAAGCSSKQVEKPRTGTLAERVGDEGGIGVYPAKSTLHALIRLLYRRARLRMRGFGFKERPLDALPDSPFMVTEHGNKRGGFCAYAPNTVFVSRSHARNHGGEHFVYNGIPIEDYPLKTEKQDYITFLAKVSWSVKNIQTACHLALDTGLRLRVGGGDPWSERKARGLWRWRARHRRDHIESLGWVVGQRKLDLLQNGLVLFSLVNWEEPYGLVIQESLACGTPVLATPNGALSERIEHGKNGWLVRSYREALEVVEHVKAMSDEERARMAEYCRSTVYTIEEGADEYLKMYETILERGYLYPPDRAERLIFRRPRSVVVKWRPRLQPATKTPAASSTRPASSA